MFQHSDILVDIKLANIIMRIKNTELLNKIIIKVGEVLDLPDK